MSLLFLYVGLVGSILNYHKTKKIEICVWRSISKKKKVDIIVLVSNPNLKINFIHFRIMKQKKIYQYMRCFSNVFLPSSLLSGFNFKLAKFRRK